MQSEFTYGPPAKLSCFTTKHVKHNAPNSFSCFTVCPFWEKLGKYYSKMCGKLRLLPHVKVSVRCLFKR